MVLYTRRIVNICLSRWKNSSCLGGAKIEPDPMLWTEHKSRRVLQDWFFSMMVGIQVIQKLPVKGNKGEDCLLYGKPAGMDAFGLHYAM